MTTLVLCVDRTNNIGRKTGLSMPVVGWEAVRSLVTDVGLADPEDSSVNCLLEALRVTRELRDEREDAEIAVISGTGDNAVGADRSVALQLDDLLSTFEAEAAVVVIDSAEDERLVPVIESRLRVDAVDRVVVRQAHDIESTYYLLKQFLADEELRSTILVPIGVGLLLLPLLLVQFTPAVAMAGLAALAGAVFLYKGLAIDKSLSDAQDQIRDSLYTGQVSVVTYAVAAGLAIVGLFLGALSIRGPGLDGNVLVPSVLFIYHSVPWLAFAALTASAGRLIDELIGNDGVPSSYMNLPFGVIAIGLVVRGFAGYLLERQGFLDHLVLLGRLELTPVQRLTMFITAGIIISLVGVRISATVSDETFEDVVEKRNES